MHACMQVGMGLAFAVWAHQKLTGRPYSLPLNTPYDSFAHMAHQMRELLDQVLSRLFPVLLLKIVWATG